MLNRIAIIAILALAGFAGSVSLRADDPPAAESTELTEAEAEFVKLLANRSLLGSFTMDKQGDDQPLHEERYEIGNVTKISENLWTVEARVKYGKVDATVPVPVQVKWAGDTAMIQVTDLTIPLMGSGFSARVLFYGDRYAGTWQHGPVGGHMFGHVVDTPVEAGEPATPSP
jgi:hypothetical protein